MVCNELHVGDRVFHSTIGLEGVVMDFLPYGTSEPYIGVDFGPSYAGHRLDEHSSMHQVRLPANTGWWCERRFLTLIESADNAFGITSTVVLDFLNKGGL